MRKIIFCGAIFVFMVGSAWGSYTWYRAHNNLVTLNVRDADVRVVARSIEWQTWEKIIVHREVSGRVTLNVHDMPLERVLGIISEQLSARWQAIYPLYSSRKSRFALEKVVVGGAKPQESGWSAYETQPIRGAGGGVFGANLRAENQLVNMKVAGKDIGVVALGLARYAQAQVVPEDGTKGSVHLTMSQGTMPQAVAKLAGQVDRRWTRLYTLQVGRRFDAARREGGTQTNQVFGGDYGQGPPPEVIQRYQQQFEAQLQTMSPDEQKRAQEMRQRWEKMRNLTPEERRQQFAQMMSDPQVQQQMQQRMVQRIKDSTPQERAERYQRMAQRRAARAARGG
jgi:type II secretory pathway component GspD/PulD (secretin)